MPNNLKPPPRAADRKKTSQATQGVFASMGNHCVNGHGFCRRAPAAGLPIRVMRSPPRAKKKKKKEGGGGRGSCGGNWAGLNPRRALASVPSFRPPSEYLDKLNKKRHSFHKHNRSFLSMRMPGRSLLLGQPLPGLLIARPRCAGDKSHPPRAKAGGRPLAPPHNKEIRVGATAEITPANNDTPHLFCGPLHCAPRLPPAGGNGPGRGAYLAAPETPLGPPGQAKGAPNTRKSMPWHIQRPRREGGNAGRKS